MSETHQDKEDPFQLKWARINEAKEKIDEVYSKFGKLSSELYEIMNDSVKGLPEKTMEEVLDRLRKHNTACVANMAENELIVYQRDTSETLLRQIADLGEETNLEVELTSLESFKQIGQKLLLDNPNAMERNKLESAEMLLLAANFFRSKWNDKDIEETAIPYDDYTSYIKANSFTLDSYPDNWKEALIPTMIHDGYVFHNVGTVLCAKPATTGLQGYPSDKPVHPIISQRKDFDLRRHARGLRD